MISMKDGFRYIFTSLRGGFEVEKGSDHQKSFKRFLIPGKSY